MSQIRPVIAYCRNLVIGPIPRRFALTSRLGNACQRTGPQGARQPGIAAARSGGFGRRVHQPMCLYVGGELFHGTSPVKVIEPDRLDWPEELRAEFALGVPRTTASLADHDRLGAKAVDRPCE